MPISDLARAKVRARFAADMTDTVTITRGGLGALDPATGVVAGVDGAQATVYSGAARCAVASASGEVALGEGDVAQRQMTVHLPWDAPVFQVNDVLVVTAHADPRQVGSSWRIAGIGDTGSWAALTELQCVGWYPSSLWDGTES